MIDIPYIKIFHEIWNIFLIWISLNVPSYYAIFRKLLYFWNYLEFSKTVWHSKSKNIKYDFARILGMKATQIYIYSGWINCTKKGCERYFMTWIPKVLYWGEGEGYMKWIEYQKKTLLNITIDIKDLLQPFLIQKIQFIQPPYMYRSVRPSCPIFGQNLMWCFYSLHLKPFWKIPSSFRNIAIFWK